MSRTAGSAIAAIAIASIATVVIVGLIIGGFILWWVGLRLVVTCIDLTVAL